MEGGDGFYLVGGEGLFYRWEVAIQVPKQHIQRKEVCVKAKFKKEAKATVRSKLACTVGKRFADVYVGDPGAKGEGATFITCSEI